MKHDPNYHIAKRFENEMTKNKIALRMAKEVTEASEKGSSKER